jgi:DNA-binding winged helix-turn-helix (wHTH) protein/tetratricopeptide (TPR) repeat protein
MDPGPEVVYEFGPFLADPRRQLLLRDDQPVPISRKVFEALLILVRHRGDVVTKDDLMTELWPDAFVEESNLSQTIFMLRKALGDTPENRQYIVTLPGRGYRFAADVRAVDLDGEFTLIESRTRSQVLVEQAENEPHTTVTALPAIAKPRTWWKYSIPIAAFVALLAVAMVILTRWRRPLVLGEKGSVLIADFKNTTGDPVFDDTLRQGLTVQLEQSPYLMLIPEEHIQHTLLLMGQPAGARMIPELAREVCKRVGGAAVLDGSIASLGSQYVVGLRATGCQSGDLIDEEQVQAARKEDVLNALSQIASKFRRRLGESLETIKKYDTPLAEATTPSIEALNDYSKALHANSSFGGVSAIPLLQRAVAIDPTFAMAYAYLGRIYGDLGETTLSSESATRAYQLRDRVSDREKFFISATYERQVTGNLEKARETLALWTQTYPRDSAPWSLLSGGTSLGVGEFERGAEAAQKAINLDPDQSFPYTNRAINDVALGRMAHAKNVLQQAAQRRLETPDLLAGQYHIAFLEGDHPEMERVVAQSQGKPGVEDCIAGEEANALAYSGQLRLARRVSMHAVNMAGQMGDRERAAEYQMEAAVREALLGNVLEAKRSAMAAVTLSKGRDVEYGAAFALAKSGDSSLSEALANDLDKRFPEDTLVRFNYLPTLRALLALDNGSPSKAVELLQVASPYEMGFSADSVVFFGALYPVYVRGEAYLAEHRGAEAAAEFQQIIDHRGIVLSDPIGVLAHLQLGRAYGLAGDIQKAKAGYQGFLELWKNADPDIPVLREAKAEYAKLR